ncbi:MAG: hypothetical protein CW691_00590 [Candidatus Bathyarchaeum sp.]|nr:MAG: hypothetical protein CW691_00590 [Candidatus Bathyarchaeum sp.]
MEEMLAPVLFMLLVGGLSGYFSGKVVKRISGMALMIGIIAASLIILVYAGTFNVNLDPINASVANFLSVLTALGVVAMVSSVPFVASFIAGIFIGYRRY